METLTQCSPILPLALVYFIIVYFVGYLGFLRNWSPRTRAEASSSFMSLGHGTPSVLLVVYSLFFTQTPFDFAYKNTDFQNLVLEFSIAYFIIDTFHYLIFFPNDNLFIAHHLATLYVLVTCRYVIGHGAFAILVLLLLAEITSGCQNVWSLSRIRKAEAAAAAAIYDFLSPFFYTYYSVVRGFFGPLFVHEMGVFFLSGAADHVIPKWAWISWMVVIISAIMVSILWVLNLWVRLFKERIDKVQKKMK